MTLLEYLVMRFVGRGVHIKELYEAFDNVAVVQSEWERVLTNLVRNRTITVSEGVYELSYEGRESLGEAKQLIESIAGKAINGSKNSAPTVKPKW